MSVPYLKLVSSKPSVPTAFERIDSAAALMMISAQIIRMSAQNLRASSEALKVHAKALEAKIPLFGAAKERLDAEAKRSRAIAAEAETVELDILRRCARAATSSAA